jgi:hypothetical protein
VDHDVSLLAVVASVPVSDWGGFALLWPWGCLAVSCSALMARALSADSQNRTLNSPRGSRVNFSRPLRYQRFSRVRFVLRAVSRLCARIPR